MYVSAVRRYEGMRILLLPLLASALSGVSAIFEKLSVVNLSPLTVLTLRYLLMMRALLFLGEPASAQRLLGTGLIIAGIVLVLGRALRQ